ncbi:MAG TPA: shikimate kinase [Flavitalea sp.]|nr:shikimate kinase [Flavitalea sp.]
MKIFLIGFMGSGKTHWGERLARSLRIPFFDLDKEIVDKEGRSIPEIFAESGEEQFRIVEKQLLESLIETQSSMVLSCGGGTPCFFNNIELMKKNGLTVWLNTPVDILMQRLLKEKNERPLLKNMADSEMKAYIVRKLNERRLYYEQADVILEKDNDLSINDFIQNILHV